MAELNMENLLGNLREDIDLLTYDKYPSVEEIKIVNDISYVIAMIEKGNLVPYRIVDKAKVIKGLECCIKENGCHECPYEKSAQDCGKEKDLDVLALLNKEDETFRKSKEKEI